MTYKTKALAADAPSARRDKVPSSPKHAPVQYRYQLAQFVAERRDDGWYFAKSWSTAAGEKPSWQGPFELPEALCIAIARLLCAELSNRHQVQAGFHKLKVGDGHFGLPPPPNLAPRPKCGGRS